MNKVIFMGRLVKDPEIRYSQGPEQIAIGRYTLAVNRRGKDQGADFIPCITFGKSATFAEKYFQKGQMVAVVGRLQVRSWEDKSGNKRWTTEVVVEEQHFTGGKEEGGQAKPKSEGENAGFYPLHPEENGAAKPFAEGKCFDPIDESIEDDDLPF